MALSPSHPQDSTPAAAPALPRYEYRPAIRGGFELIHHFMHRGRPSNVTVAFTGFEEVAQELVNGFNERAALAARNAELEAALSRMIDQFEGAAEAQEDLDVLADARKMVQR